MQITEKLQKQGGVIDEYLFSFPDFYYSSQWALGLIGPPTTLPTSWKVGVWGFGESQLWNRHTSKRGQGSTHARDRLFEARPGSQLTQRPGGVIIDSSHRKDCRSEEDWVSFMHTTTLQTGHSSRGRHPGPLKMVQPRCPLTNSSSQTG